MSAKPEVGLNCKMLLQIVLLQAYILDRQWILIVADVHVSLVKQVLEMADKVQRQKHKMAADKN